MLVSCQCGCPVILGALPSCNLGPRVTFCGLGIDNSPAYMGSHLTDTDNGYQERQPYPRSTAGCGGPGY